MRSCAASTTCRVPTCPPPTCVLAGIVAEGETRVHNIKHIDRGYEDYCGKLSQLGANVSRRQVGAAE